MLDTNKLHAAPVRPNNAVASLSEDGSLSDLGPSIQFHKPIALAEVAEQFYETVLSKEVRHSFALRDPYFFEVQFQSHKENGVPEALYGLLQVSQMIQRRRR